MYSATIFVLVLITAIAAIITALPPLGFDVRLVGRGAAMIGEESAVTTPAHLNSNRARWWVVLIISCLALIGSIVGLYRIANSPSRPQSVSVTSENVRAYIEQWCDDNSLSERLLSANELSPNDIFNVDVTLGNGHHAYIERTKPHDTYLVIYSNWISNQATQDEVKKLSPDEVAQITAELEVNLAIVRADAQVTGPFKTFHIERHIPIANLTEDTFISNLLDVERGMTVAVDTVGLWLGRIKQQAPPHAR